MIYHPLEFAVTFHDLGMDIFWNYTILLVNGVQQRLIIWVDCEGPSYYCLALSGQQFQIEQNSSICSLFKIPRVYMQSSSGEAVLVHERREQVKMNHILCSYFCESSHRCTLLINSYLTASPLLVLQCMKFCLQANGIHLISTMRVAVYTTQAYCFHKFPDLLPMQILPIRVVNYSIRNILRLSLHPLLPSALYPIQKEDQRLRILFQACCSFTHMFSLQICASDPWRYTPLHV